MATRTEWDYCSLIWNDATGFTWDGVSGLPREGTKVVDLLKAAGCLGWELVTVEVHAQTRRWILKRPV